VSAGAEEKDLLYDLDSLIADLFCGRWTWGGYAASVTATGGGVEIEGEGWRCRERETGRVKSKG